MIAVAAFLPFITQTENDGINGIYSTHYIRPEALHLSFAFGALLALISLWSARMAAGRGVPIMILVLGILGTVGYTIFMIIGEVGVTTDDFGTKVNWSPSVGIVLSTVGSLGAIVGAIKLLRRPRSEDPDFRSSYR